MCVSVSRVPIIPLSTLQLHFLLFTGACFSLLGAITVGLLLSGQSYPTLPFSTKEIPEPPQHSRGKKSIYIGNSSDCPYLSIPLKALDHLD